MIQRQPSISGKHEEFYSLLTLPANLTTGVVNFFSDTMTNPGRHRTNMEEANKVNTAFELHALGFKFLAPDTVTFANIIDALRDAHMVLFINSVEMRVWHLTQFMPQAFVGRNAGAAAGDGGPYVSSVGTQYKIQIDTPILIPANSQFRFEVRFATNVASLAATVAGLFIEGIKAGAVGTAGGAVRMPVVQDSLAM